MSFWDAVKGFFSVILNGAPELYDMLDVSEGRLTREEAWQIVLPTALESGFYYENETAKVGCRNTWLAKDNKRNKLIWMFDFALLELEGEEMAEQMNGIGSIDLDDETGEILGVFFSR